MEMKCCPKCGSDRGYYTKMQARGTVTTRYNFDGSEADNESMYDCLAYKGGKYAYCLDCNKRLFRMDQV